MVISGNQPLEASGSLGRALGQEADRQRYLFGPLTDFLCLGGISFVLLPIMFMLPAREFSPAVGAIALGIAHFINHPHFAFSYQIFYEGFLRKAFGPDNDAALRARYIFAGILVPVGLTVFFAYSIIFGDARLLGRGANLMGFLVGWHYVKQGYGMLMVDAALKRCFFDDAEKKVLLINSYAVWALAWLLANSILSERVIWGIQFYMFPIPTLVLLAGFVVAVTTTVMVLSTLIAKQRRGDGLPLNGVVAYFVSLYLWLLLTRLNVLWLLIVPALHSLQYLTVVARFRMNKDRSRSNADEPVRPKPLGWILRRRFIAAFAALGLILGYVGFWGAPKFLQATIPYDQEVFGATVFLFVFWMFINVHHYFLDNVMWRRTNPEVAKYLFAARDN